MIVCGERDRNATACCPCGPIVLLNPTFRAMNRSPSATNVAVLEGAICVNPWFNCPVIIVLSQPSPYI
ncbi:hypothetical protein HanIR_Chr15g0731061 [Helianthus annuus]|nr:hypothetical protein HanIR_Chr15g0731061 [Helianthus annuus]